ncbi:hypothetical protein QTI33_11850 [Variovorax sp. J22P271]|uniref:hypothetical protein n=1 Tax=Variovorax davisae TaxID=3053515 RepID=UPI0025782F0C|nr:hypothetical protein [Variovorax sp. J22P271]MDM0032817.1 hypothetical protein [Variovorax sp. J22P271]
MKIESGPMPAGRRPDAFETRLRFCCGALLGLLVGLGMCVKLWPLGIFAVCALLTLAVVACGMGAARLGDRFWAGLRWLQ